MSWSGRELATIAQRLRQATPCPAFSITSVSELWFVTLNPMHSFSQIFEIFKQSAGSYYNLMPTVKRQWNWWPYNVIVWFSEVFNVHLLNEELPEVQQDNPGHRWFEKQEPPCLVVKKILCFWLDVLLKLTNVLLERACHSPNHLHGPTRVYSNSTKGSWWKKKFSRLPSIVSCC